MYVAHRKRIIRLGESEVDLGDFFLTDFVCPRW